MVYVITSELEIVDSSPGSITIVFSGLSSVIYRDQITALKPRLVVNTAIPWIAVVFAYRGSMPR